MNARIPKDLSLICLKAMEKNPRHRYQTMAGFAEDLNRFLAGEQVLAQSAGWTRKSSKWIRRHKLLSITAAVVLAAASVLAVFTTEFVRQQKERARIIEQRFKPIDEVLRRLRIDFFSMCRWCNEADPDDPHADMLRTLFYLKTKTFDRAAAYLEDCIARCRKSGNTGLLKDAHYLLGVIQLNTAAGKKDDEEKKALLNAAEQNLLAAGKSTLSSPDRLVWCRTDPAAVKVRDAVSFIENIRINNDHFIAHFYNGVSLFSPLYKGGERRYFEDSLRYLEKALEIRPDHMMTLNYAGRAYYFYTRFFDFPDMTGIAEEHLNRALRSSGEVPYHFIETTLGQNSLLRGDWDSALKHFNNALILFGRLNRERTTTIHNSWRGIGKVYTQQGRFDEAIEMLDKALRRVFGDPHTLTALAEHYLLRGDLDNAMKYANSARTLLRSPTIEMRAECYVASTYLICARVHLERNENIDAYTNLDKIYAQAYYSPRDYCLAVLLIASFPKEKLMKDGRITPLAKLAGSILEKIGSDILFEGKVSPIHLSTRGAVDYLNGYYPEAADYFLKALAERKKWSQEVRKYRWHDDARDLYFLAMIYKKLPSDRADDFWEESMAWKCFDQAEALYLENGAPCEYADIFKRVRRKAIATLGVSER